MPSARASRCSSNGRWTGFRNARDRLPAIVGGRRAAQRLAIGAGADGTGAGQRLKATEGPAERPLVGLKERTDAGLPTFSQRAADRTSVAAGAVLGALGAVAIGSTARGIRSLVRRPPAQGRWWRQRRGRGKPRGCWSKALTVDCRGEIS